MGRGVSHCASCDGPLYNGQTVGVVGGGDSALQEALTLANYSERVLLFHKGSEFSAPRTYQQRVLSEAKITPRYRTVVEEVLGDEVVSGVRVRDLASGDSEQVDLAGLFVYVGMKPHTELLQGIVQLSGTGHVPTDVSMNTERPGLYAVGDIRQDSASQAITSAGDGAAAAIAAYRYIKENFR
jgi:thioredoxin reductase (NADPH)